MVREFCNNCGSFTCEYGVSLPKFSPHLYTPVCTYPSLDIDIDLNFFFFQEQAADKFRYITYGTLDDPEQLPPQGEFFCKDRASWMPDIPGKKKNDNLFHSNFL